MERDIQRHETLQECKESKKRQDKTDEQGKLETQSRPGEREEIWTRYPQHAWLDGWIDVYVVLLGRCLIRGEPERFHFVSDAVVLDRRIGYR